MVLVGLLLIAVAAGFTTDVFLQNSQHVSVDVLGRSFSVTPGWIVVAGLLALAVFVLGARLLALGVIRARRRRSMLRGAERAASERDQLARQLAAQNVEEDAPPVDQGEQSTGAVPSTID
jgi:hypothetical protein